MQLNFWQRILHALGLYTPETSQAPAPAPIPAQPKPAPTPAPSPVIAPPGGPTQIVDLSRYQPNMNWTKLISAGFQGVVAQATNGTIHEDAMFRKHAANARAHGLPFGAYCFNRFHSDPFKQAEFFVKTVGERTRWLVADIEFDKSSATIAKFGDKYVKGMDNFARDHSIRFLEKVYSLTGVRPWIYLNGYHFVGFDHPEVFLPYSCWISNYIQKRKDVKDLDLNLVHLPKPYKKQNVIAWQWTSTHPAGKAITGDPGLDANLVYATPAQLRTLELTGKLG